MLTSQTIKRRGAWSGPAADTVVLDFDARYRRRIMMTGIDGLTFLFETSQATVLEDGDGILLDDGRTVVVRAAIEPLLRIEASDPEHLTRLAWHIGNRHLACEIADGGLYIREDHVIEQMLLGLGAGVMHVERPFQPEGGAYSGHGHAHESEPKVPHG